jgi:ubiquinone/menaquinone biosynthesis C-methylase UbiE
MISPSLELPQETGRAFDTLAEDYDELFTRSSIGRAQRNVVWEYAAKLFSTGDHILELNCGTGEDALYLARLGAKVTACDASEQMIDQAERRQQIEAPLANVRFKVMPSEQILKLREPMLFDGVFSNFSGLNCVTDLAVVAEQLSRCVKEGAPLLLCMSTRVCLWEIVYFSLHGRFRKAFRRCSGQTQARLGDISFRVQYPTITELRTLFAPAFRLRAHSGVGVVVPPSYVESWARKHPGLLGFLQRVDRVISHWPGFRVVGDHMLLHFEKVQP